MGQAPYGDIFVPEPAGNLVTRSTISDTGSGLFLAKAYEHADFLTSIEERFRPVWTETGPDGALYVLDLYHGIIQDAVFLTNYLKGWVDQHDLGTTHGANGRVYRISHESGSPTRIIDLTTLSAEDLVAQLASDNGWYRDHAQRLLVVRQMREAVSALIALFHAEVHVAARLHALWTLQGLGAVSVELVLHALASEDREIRSAGLRVAEAFIADETSPVTAAFLAAIGNANDWSVRYQLAASAGALGDAHRVSAILTIVTEYGAEHVVVDAALSGLRDTDVVDFLAARSWRCTSSLPGRAMQLPRRPPRWSITAPHHRRNWCWTRSVRPDVLYGSGTRCCSVSKWCSLVPPTRGRLLQSRLSSLARAASAPWATRTSSSSATRSTHSMRRRRHWLPASALQIRAIVRLPLSWT